MHRPLLLAAVLLPALLAAAADDIVFADFEGADYGVWTAKGEAFGGGPAHGALPGQMHVEGFAGKGLVNSFNKGDDSKGVLTSPEFKIERKAISFLIGGGGYEGKTCVNLLVDGKIARTAVGPNTAPGGSERLETQAWDVAEFAGKNARIEFIDSASGSWGHINVDQVVFTDRKPAVNVKEPTRSLTLDQRYLLFPVKTGAKKHRVAVLIDGAVVRDFEIELADDPQWWAQLDVGAWAGKTATVRVDALRDDSTALASVKTSPTLWEATGIYREPQRAQFHFSAKRGWLNDPNGMVFSQGEYHLFFQHNPYGWAWGNMHWGHAVSRDLVHWEELPIALYPPLYNDMAFSGSAVVDRSNTSGWKTGDNDLLVAAFTSTGRGECITYSNDKGRTWQEFQGNPVIKHRGRDPRLLWHSPSKQWVMAVYTEDRPGGSGQIQDIAFYTSPNLRAWTYQSRIEGFFECPDFFELPVDGDPSKTKWVLSAANSEYMLGTFDGKAFVAETPKLPGHRGAGFYAAQTFSDESNGRRIRIGWFQTGTPGGAFNQAMTIPLQLALRTTPDGIRLTWQPANEVELLRGKELAHFEGSLVPGTDPVAGAQGELIEIRADIERGEASEVGFVIRGVTVSYDATKQEVVVNGHHAPAPMIDGHQRLVIYADRTNLEVFASDGLTYVPLPVNFDIQNTRVSGFAKGGTAKINALHAYELKSIWPQ